MFRLGKALAIAAAGCAIAAPVALAATINGTSGNDTLMGTSSPDTIKALAGDDTVWGQGGNDLIDAGSGDDTVYGDGDCLPGVNSSDYCEPASRSTDGADNISGGDGNDALFGQGGNDNIDGDAGADRIYGGPGNDNIDGDDGNDVITGGSGSDNISGNDGNDKIYARDGVKDTITCGNGPMDTVDADKIDVIAKDCENVTRH